VTGVQDHDRPPSPTSSPDIPAGTITASTAVAEPVHSDATTSEPVVRGPQPQSSTHAATGTATEPGERRRPDVGDLVVRAGTAFEDYRQGKPGAIDALFRLVSPLLWHTARQCGLTAAEAEDAVQQTFLQLVRSKDSISDPLAVVRWLTVSLRRLAWREKASSSRRTHEEPTDEDLPRAPSAEHAAVLSDQQRRLWALVSELPERCRRLLAVIAFAPRPDYAAIAADLHIPVGSIGPTRGRCLAKLRARLDGGEWS
jgi:RNA polymerase sigma factor (sigma-70 family)